MAFGRHSSSMADRAKAAHSDAAKSGRRLGLSALLALLALSPFAGTGCTADHDQLLEDAKSDRAEIRASAIQRIGQDPWPNDDAVLFAASRDPSSMVRLAVAKALYKTDDDPKVQDLLASLLDDAVPEIQEIAVQGLLRTPTPKNLAYLRNAYMKRGWATRRVIGKYASPEQLAVFVQSEAMNIWKGAEQEFREGASARQEKAARLLGESGQPEAAGMLLARLNDPAAEVPVVAGTARGLALMGEKRAVPRLLQILTGENLAALRQAVMMPLAELDAPEAVASIAEVAAQDGPDAPEALKALSAMSAHGGTSSRTASAALCKLLTTATPKNAEARAEAAIDGRAECNLAEVGKDVALGGTAAVSALKILARMPEPALADVLIEAFQTADSEVLPYAWKALAPLAPKNPAASRALTSRLDTYFESSAAAHAKWIPEARIHGLWPEDLFEEMKPDFDHDHSHGGAVDEKELTLEDFGQQGASVTSEDMARMIAAQNKNVRENKVRRKNMEELMERLDKAAKVRAEAMGLKPGTDLKRVFAYGTSNLVPDESVDGEAAFHGMIRALAWLPDYPLTPRLLGSLWRDPDYRADVCELAGARYGLNAGAAKTQEGAAPGAENKAAAAAPARAENSSAEEVKAAEGTKEAPDAAEIQAAAPVIEAEDRDMTAEQIVRLCLRSRVQDDQTAALRGLVRRGKDALPAIEEALSNRTEQRTELIYALRDLGAASQKLPSFRHLLSAGGTESIAAMEMVVQLKDTTAVPHLLDALNEPALPERRRVIEALRKLGRDVSGVREALEAELFSDVPEVRQAALLALSDLGLLAATPKAAALRMDYNARVRALADAAFAPTPAKSE